MKNHDETPHEALDALAFRVLQKLDALLPEAPAPINWSALAFRFQVTDKTAELVAINTLSLPPLSRIQNVDEPMLRLKRNTEQFLAGKGANNALLTGARGTGKSSIIKGLLHEYAKDGLRLIEVDKAGLLRLPALLKLLQNRTEKFIIFCDDLSFDTSHDNYNALKSTLDGSLFSNNNQVLIYATSNRRHLVSESLSDNNHAHEVHPKEAVEEKISLSDRFGLWLHFYPFDQEAYLAAVASWLEAEGLALDTAARAAALDWARIRGNRSGRTAYQFARDYVAQCR